MKIKLLKRILDSQRKEISLMKVKKNMLICRLNFVIQKTKISPNEKL